MRAILILIGCGFAATAFAAAPQATMKAKTAAQPAVIELGKIGTSTPSAQDNQLAKPVPSKQAALAVLKAKGNGSETLGPTYRVTPRTLYDPHIGVYLWCTESAGILSTRGGANYWQCQSGQSNQMWFDFRQLSANSTYLVTVSHAFMGGVDVVTEENGQEQATTIDPAADPLFLVFHTGAGQTTATLKLFARGGAYQSGGSWYSLEIAKVQ